MNIFSSGWLQRMADKAGNTPAVRLQALFHILQDWVEVPGFRQQLQAMLSDEVGQRMLKAYLLQLAEASKMPHPELVASQVHMMLLGALNEESRQPGSQALEYAGQAAMLLLNAQTRPRRYSHVAIAAAVVVALGTTALLVTKHQPEQAVMAAHALPMAVAMSAAPNPERVAAFYHLHEQIRTANCSYPQALMLAPEQRAPFIETVVDGNVGEIKPESMGMVSQLYQKIDCYYPPAAMLL